MIACLYGRPFGPFLEGALRDLCGAAADAGGRIEPLTIETVLADPRRGADVHRLYVLPFDVPPGHDSPGAVVRRLFPKAEPFTSFAAQDLCWDKLATQERLLDRGVPVPETLVTSDPEEVGDFVAYHGFALLKERFTCGGQGHIVMWYEEGALVGDCGSHRYLLDLHSSGPRELTAEHLRCGGPFYVQRLIADRGARELVPGQVLRAYIVDNEIRFWTERYRERYTRPADWIVTAGRGARYRFVLSVSEEAKKVALRSAEVVGIRAGVVDVVRTGRGGPYVLEVDTDGRHMLVDRSFKLIPDYREFYDYDRYVAEALLAEPAPVQTRATQLPRTPRPRALDQRPARPPGRERPR